MPRHTHRRTSPDEATPRRRSPIRMADTVQDETGHRRPLRVLVVDGDPQLAQQVVDCAQANQPLKVTQAATLAQAQAVLGAQPVDLAVIEPELSDGSGLELARTLRRRRRRTQTLVVTKRPSMEGAIEAIRLGAIDFLVKPLDLDQLGQRVREAAARHRHDRHQTQRIRRLRRACHKLNQAREEISQQVDILCSDLVGAYQELADRMEQSVSSAEYQAMVRQELSLEQLLRKTLEYLVERAGPTNAALFLPANSEEFSLGGYVNFDCSREASDLLLQHLGDIFAPRVADHDRVLRLNNDDDLHRCIGDDAAYLAECDVIAFSSRHEGESLAVLTLFRDRSEPFDDELVNICASIAPVMAEALARLIRIHHRRTLLDDDRV